MKLTFANILMLLLAAVGCTSCIYEYGAEPGNPVEDQPNLPGDVYLNLSVGVLTQPGDPTSRANEVDQNNYFESPSSKYERLNTLRIIIVRGERLPQEEGEQTVSPDKGLIEHNILYKNFSESGMDFHDNMVFKVKAGEKKKIYLIANEKYLKDKGLVDFQNWGATYPQENPLEDIVLTADANNLLFNNTEESTATYIPMSESYEIDVPLPQSPKDYQMTENLFITRAAVKFSFVVNTVEDFKDTGLKVKKIIVNGVSNKEYFLPRATYSDPITMDNGLTGRYVTSFEIPDPVSNQPKPYTFSPNIDLKFYNNEVVENTQKVKGYLYAPALYFPETKKGNNQKYTITITIGEEGNSNDDITFPEVELTNLLTDLPRNTHAVVNITVTKRFDITATVKLVPYIGVTLEPEFGFDELIPWHNQDNPEE